MRLKRVTSICIALLLVLMSCITSFATDSSTTEEVENYGYIPDPYERLTTNVSGLGTEYSTKYDPRESGIGTDLRSQWPYGLCWMYAAAACAEHNVYKNYGRKFDISERHGAVAMSNSIKPLNSTSKDYFSNIPNTGSGYYKSSQYFTNWNSPIFNENTISWNAIVSENDFPVDFSTNTGYIPNNVFSDAESLFNVTETFYISNDMISIKNAISRYGAVGTGMYCDPDVLNDTNRNNINYFYSNIIKKAPNHEVAIIGWDDNYPKENFVNVKSGETPTHNGAWLVKNSNAGGNYLWISYQEGSLDNNQSEKFVISGVQKNSDNEFMLSYDYQYLTADSNVYYNEAVYLCNIYDITDYLDVYNRISKVMFYLRSTGCTYNIKILQLDNNNNLPDNLSNYMSLASGTYQGEGYITADLSNDFVFTSGNKCAVIVELNPLNSNSLIYLPREIHGYFGESYTGLENNTGLISWNFLNYKDGYANYCIRPVLAKEINSEHDVQLTPSQVIDTSANANILVESDCELFSIHTISNIILREGIDYTYTSAATDASNGTRSNFLTISNNFLQSLNGLYTELVLEFNNDITRTLIINPKSVLSNVEFTGRPVIGETLTANCTGIPPKDEYDVSYQWQSSPNKITWYNISGATTQSFTVTDNEYLRYIRVKVTANRFGNVEYPKTIYSASTSCKAVIWGDANMDGEVTITDATLIQKYLAELVTFTDEQRLAADVNNDGEVNITDSTMIQQYIIS